jgi:hypothetical protein
VEEQILAQYRRFWTETYPSVFASSAQRRLAILRPVVAEPLLAELLRIAGTLDRRYQGSTGSPRPLRQVVSRKGGEAVVFGCLDMSHVVVIDRRSGAELDRGQRDDVTYTYYSRGTDGVWRAYALSEPAGAKC